MVELFLGMGRHDTVNAADLSRGFRSNGFGWCRVKARDDDTGGASVALMAEKAAQAASGSKGGKGDKVGGKRQRGGATGATGTTGAMGTAENSNLNTPINPMKLITPRIQHSSGRAPDLEGGDTAANAGPAEHQQRQHMGVMWIHWLFSELVLPIVRSHFYVTDSEIHSNRVFFFRKALWARISSVALSTRLLPRVECLSQEQAAHLLRHRQERPFGAASLRLLPKRNGIRFIVNMSKQALPPQIPAVSHRKQHRGAAVGTRFAGAGKSVGARGDTGRRTGGNGAGGKRVGLSRTSSTTRQRVHRSIRPRFEQKSANAALTDTFHVIKHEVGYGNAAGSGARGWHLGAAVNGIDSIYRRFRCGWSGSK